uniref:Uncharacterized protein n=1 Tax=Myotis lucifugus TaxID=59463 RepID=G1PZX0_MYOLU
MTPTIRALLCLGLSVGLRTPVQAGPLPKPTIWAEPGPVIPQGSPVTIWCQGIPGAVEYCLEKDRNPAQGKREKPWEPGDKAKFSITHMTEYDAGIYHCYYQSPMGWSEHSDPLKLVVMMTGRRSQALLDPGLTATAHWVVPGPVPCGPRDPAQGDVQMLWLLQAQTPGVLTPQRCPGAPGLRLHSGESHPDG